MEQSNEQKFDVNEDGKLVKRDDEEANFEDDLTFEE